MPSYPAMTAPSLNGSRNGFTGAAPVHGKYGKADIHDFDNQLTCISCSEVLVVGENWHASHAEGRKRICKGCHKQRHRDWREKNRGKERGYAARNNRTLSGRFSVARGNANRRSMSWDLGKKEYASLIQKPCHYCGHALNSTGVGLDQMIPGLGYTTGNVVPCCHECNTAKHDHFTHEEMLLIGAVIKKIKDKRSEEVLS